jgi:uncharacterized protein
VRRVLVDTGPLVAILSADDQYHDLCVSTLRELPGTLVSCWPVLTEVAWLVRRHTRVQQQFFAAVGSGFLQLASLNNADAKVIGELMANYENIRPQLADAALVYLSERDEIDTIFTLDRLDFSVYRRSTKRAFQIIPQIG